MSNKTVAIIAFIAFVSGIFNLIRFPNVLTNKWDIAFVSFTVFFVLANLIGFIVTLYEWFRERH